MAGAAIANNTECPRERAGGIDPSVAAAIVGELYEAHFSFVWRSLRRLGVQESLVDDATHDVFVVIYRRFSEFDRRSSLKTWIFGIAHRISQQYRRRLLDTKSSAQCDDVADQAVGPMEAQENRERVRLLHHLLSKLDEEKRAVFILAELEEMTAPEIAETLGIKLNTVYSRLRAGRVEFDTALARVNSSVKKAAR